MPGNIFSTFDTSGRGMTVQRARMDAIADNIANANTTRVGSGGPYKREVVVVTGEQTAEFGSVLGDQLLQMNSTQSGHLNSIVERGAEGPGPGITAQRTVGSGDPRRVYDPSHPDADADGYVSYPDVNVVTEMVDMITAQRAFEANTTAISAAKTIAKDSLEI
jgi:flagellar basal-body rod protein FlgC